MEEVKNIKLPNGTTYSGFVKIMNDSQIPHGMGICKYEDHNESGMFQDGNLQGIAYLNYHDWMLIGLSNDGSINGWGLKADRGKLFFGVFEDSVLKINLTPLVQIFWNKIMEDSKYYKFRVVSVLKNGEIFAGTPQITRGRNGFHFLNNGEVFVGACEYDHSDITGKFLHFDLSYNITKGEFKNGKLVREISDEEFVEACDVWVNHAYLDFDINMNYDPDNFLLWKTRLMHIFEMGKTEQNLIVKANICKVHGNQVQYKGGDCEDTTWFFFPNDNEEIEEELMSLTENEEHPWAPDFSDYCVEFVNNLSNSGSDHLIVYKHISCWDKDAYYVIDNYDYMDWDELDSDNEDEYEYEDEGDLSGGFMLRLIPDYSSKYSLLTEQWRSKGWYYTYPSLKDYVYSLGEDDDVDNFFGWLFNNARFDGYKVWNLPPDYHQAFEQFLNLFPSCD